jgi:hypothetical protein
MGIESVRLKNHRHVPISGRELVDTAAPQEDLACVGTLKASNQTQEGRLATARRANQDDQFTSFNFQVNPPHHGLSAERLS